MKTRFSRIAETEEQSHTVDALQVALLSSDRFSLLPELYDIFGKETLLKFLDIFGGSTITIPEKSELENLLRDVVIFVQYPTDKKRAVISRYGLEEIDAKKIYLHMKSIIEDSFKLKLVECIPEPEITKKS